jgi:hypothetical protein
MIALLTLSEIHPKSAPAISAVSSLACDTNVPVACCAILALGDLGADATPAVPTLARLLSNTNRKVRVQATNALCRIDPVAAAEYGINTNAAAR